MTFDQVAPRGLGHCRPHLLGRGMAVAISLPSSVYLRGAWARLLRDKDKAWNILSAVDWISLLYTAAVRRPWDVSGLRNTTGP